MKVSSGFYVRSLCHDLGVAVDSAGLMASLVRSRQSNFELGKNVIEYEDFEKGSEVWEPQVKKALEEWQEMHPQGKQRDDGGEKRNGRGAGKGGLERRERRNSSSVEPQPRERQRNSSSLEP
jgi:tRNA pseudouridine55 synthase